MPFTILAIAFIVALVFIVLSRSAVERVAQNHYEQRADFFHRYPVNKGDIVFLGDSITDGGAWEELLPGVPLKNRGINADDTLGVLRRLDDILRAQPLAIFLLIGTNDLPWWTYRKDEDILKTYSQILDRCKELSPDTRVFVQSLLPRAKTYAKRVKRMNAGLEKLAASHGFTFVNLYPAYVDAEGALQAELTNDNLHLMSEGYTRWVNIIQPYIEELVGRKIQSP
jgi:lysophospholipase L1-like esterase